MTRYAVPFVFLILFFGTLKVHGQQDTVAAVLDRWHWAAAEADYDTYFGLMAKESVFIGTDATENWSLAEFKEFSKPYFDRGKAWSFTALERHIYLSESGDLAWFDELLSTQMGICRGSGVVLKTAEGWKVKHYVLSIAIPNDKVDAITRIKADDDQSLIKRLVRRGSTDRK